MREPPRPTRDRGVGSEKACVQGLGRAPPGRFEHPTVDLEGRCSIQLSYGGTRAEAAPREHSCSSAPGYSAARSRRLGREPARFTAEAIASSEAMTMLLCIPTPKLRRPPSLSAT